MTEPASSIPWLQAEQLACERGNRALFDSLDFRLEAGQLLQVEGANGSGKTSLLRLLCGLALPSAGRLRWHGRDLADCRADYLAQAAYVGHQAGIKGELTPLENLRMARALGGTAASVSPAQALARLDMSAFAQVPCRRLSAGQRRRVALAALLLRPARLWLLDEPFTALDRDGIARVTEMLAAHLAGGGLLAMTTHHALRLDGHPVIPVRLGTPA